MVVMDIERAGDISGGQEESSRPPVGGTVAIHLPRGETGGIHRGNHGWRPLAGTALLERLRTTGRPRPKSDPDLAARLRWGLEQGLRTGRLDEGASAETTGESPTAGGAFRARAGPPLVVTKDRLTRVLACQAHQVEVTYGQRPPTVALACGALVDVLFRQLVTVGSLDDPMADGLAALSLDDHQRELVSWIERLPADERNEVAAEVERQAHGLLERWPMLDPVWLPRTQETLRARLADGAVELSARVDLAVGRPVEDEASVAIIEIKSGARRVEHRVDLHFYALIESLRNPAPPFVVATYYTRTGELDVDPVNEDLLMAAGRRTVVGIRRMRNLASGSEPDRRPNDMCGSCVALPTCDTGPNRFRGPVCRPAPAHGDR